MEIRRMKEADCKQILETGDPRFDCDPNGNKLALSFYYERDRSGKYESYVLEDDGRIHGILCIKRHANSLYISRLGVQKNRQRKGYGAQLLKFAVLEANHLKLDKISLETETGNIGFYEAMGFKTTRKYYDKHWGDSATIDFGMKSNQFSDILFNSCYAFIFFHD